MSTPHAPADLTFSTVDVHATEGEALQRLHAYGDAWSRGFHEGSMSEKQREAWLEHSRADDVTLRAAYPTGPLVDTTQPVGTFSSWDGSMNVGAERMLGLHMITDVTVAPTHRRRGILSRLMREDLTAAAERGVPLAALTVSEGGIYGRFGFGVATRRRRVTVTARAGEFALRHLEDDGTLVLLDPAAAAVHTTAVFEQHLARTRGAVTRPSFYRRLAEGFDFESGEPDTKLRCVLHLDAAGQPDGYAYWKHAQEGGASRVDVGMAQALTGVAHLRLWQFLTDVDLAHEVRATLPLEAPLDAAVTDPRAVRTDEVRDMLWLRVLDVPAALEARPWREDGAVVLDVADPLGLAGGRFRLTTAKGVASVTPTQDPADVHLGVETLGALYLGDRGVHTHAAAGRVTGPGVATFAALADDAGPAPWCSTGF
ncbi:GNAT family N-acetyltransferase [Nocardioides bruguierae]|uniref:GNAT family N-acetyltransferase n=1 Tax=Nocardioides bruguierae TaxID=2945102 RepID=UPI00202280AD|nr:GNAT family N-acetyltransferase [Nocardioides bruguierae]MCL8025105.1 GNAT family N-acetyltransferase [Nocardioides bruguierae]